MPALSTGVSPARLGARQPRRTAAAHEWVLPELWLGLHPPQLDGPLLGIIVFVAAVVCGAVAGVRDRASTVGTHSGHAQSFLAQL